MIAASRAAAQATVDAARDAYELARRQYREGYGARSALEAARRFLQAAEDELGNFAAVCLAPGCGYPFDLESLGRYGCPNCHGEGLDSSAT